MNMMKRMLMTCAVRGPISFWKYYTSTKNKLLNFNSIFAFGVLRIPHSSKFLPNEQSKEECSSSNIKLVLPTLWNRANQLYPDPYILYNIVSDGSRKNSTDVISTGLHYSASYNKNDKIENRNGKRNKMDHFEANGSFQSILLQSKDKNSKSPSAAGNDKVLILDDLNFKSALSKYKYMLVMFYAPWCEYCQNMKPLFHRVAREVSEERTKMAMCNADKSPKIALEYEVYVFPTLKLFREGKFAVDYAGPRRSLDLIKFVQSNTEK